MGKKKEKTKLRELFKKRDNRFWLMIFVVFSTLFIFVLWFLNLNNIFPKRSFEDDLASMGLDDLKFEIENEKESFSKIKDMVENMKMEESIINEEEVEKLKEAIGERVSSSSESEVEVKGDEASVKNKDDLIPTISQELDSSEQKIKELERKYKELEEKLNSN